MNSDRKKHAAAKQAREAARSASEALALADIQGHMQVAVDHFHEMFNWEERKIMMAAAYWAIKHITSL
jgi:hypothetical protein